MATFFPPGLHGAVRSQHLDRDRRISNEPRESCPHWDPPFHTKTNFLSPHLTLMSFCPLLHETCLGSSASLNSREMASLFADCAHVGTEDNRLWSIVKGRTRVVHQTTPLPVTFPLSISNWFLFGRLVTGSDQPLPLRLHRAIGEFCELIHSQCRRFVASVASNVKDCSRLHA